MGLAWLDEIRRDCRFLARPSHARPEIYSATGAQPAEISAEVLDLNRAVP